MKNSLIFSLTIIGTIIGAGYATGQELYSFFIMKSKNGLMYFLISVFFIIFVSLIIFIFSKNRKINSPEKLFVSLFSKPISNIYLTILTIFLFACFCVTSAGTGSLFSESIKLPYFTGVFTIIIVTYAALQFDINGVFFVNTVLTPIISVCIFILGIISLSATSEVSNIFLKDKNIFNAFLGSMMYFGYNILSLMPVIMGSSKKININSAIKGLILAFFIIFISGSIILLCMYNSNINLDIYSLPFLKIVSDISSLSENLYIVVMYFAMITTAVSCYYGFYYNISQFIRGDSRIIIISGLCLAFFVTLLGFSNLVRSVYSLFGIFGIIMAFSCIYKIVIKNI